MLDEKKIIEIRRAGFENKGAELMLCAVLERMKQEFPEAGFAVATNVTPNSYMKRAKLGLYQKADHWKKLIPLGVLFNFIPKNLREMYGVVTDKEVDVVMDAAGFGYSDQWGRFSCLELANCCKRWKKNGTKIILMPQAFGPFKSTYNIKAMKVVLDHADLVFAREKTSYDFLVNISGERSNLKIAPDYTNLTHGILPEDFDTENHRFCLVPNYRMIDKTANHKSNAYLPFMIECAKYLVKENQKPFILIHEGADDLLLAEEINKATGGVLPIIRETNPLKIKGIIGACEGTVGSRFHGIVSALSQGVPALATGWSHKYQLLFDDYGFSEGLLNVTCPKEELHKKLGLLINRDTKINIKLKLDKNTQKLKIESEKMWDDVLNILK